MHIWTKYISVVLASMIKFLGGPLAGKALDLSWVETATCTLLGMMVSVLAFTFLGEWLGHLINRFRSRPPRLFSKRTRLAVRIWRLSRIHGIALLTPIIFSPIGGTLLAISFKVPRTTIVFWMFVYGALWAIVQTNILYWFWK